MYNKIYVKHLYSVYTSRFLYITLIFSSLIFIMNILEELKFFGKTETDGIGYPILLTILNLPSNFSSSGLPSPKVVWKGLLLQF